MALREKLKTIPLIVLGLGLCRAWSAALFSYNVYTTLDASAFVIFAAASGVTGFVLALVARHITPLYKNKLIIVAACLFTGGGTLVLLVASFVLVDPLVANGAVLCAGMGGAVVQLLWCEYFGCLNPLKVGLYHSCAIFLGAALGLLFFGLDPLYLAVIAVALPLLSILWQKESMETVDEADLPRPLRGSDNTTLPYKPIALMAVCSFAIGFSQMSGGRGADWGIEGSLGELVVAALVALAILLNRKHFGFGTVYRFALPLTVIGLMFVAPNLEFMTAISGFCFDGGYAALSILIMVIMSNITYRFGANAIRINGIERGIRYLSLALGWVLQTYVVSPLPEEQSFLIGLGVTGVVIVAFALIFFSEDELSSRWGISIKSEETDRAAIEHARVSMRASEIAREYDLTSRETEVFHLMAHKTSLVKIEKDLFIAGGTLRAHIGHIYTKLGIHSRNELYALLEKGITPEEHLR